MKLKYGITRERFDYLARFGCAICGATRSRRGRLVVDHDHGSTGTFRGLLCTECNVGLGLFKDSPALLALAASYLEARNALD